MVKAVQLLKEPSAAEMVERLYTQQLLSIISLIFMLVWQNQNVL